MKFLVITLVLMFAFIIESKAQSDMLLINLKNGQTDSIAVNQIKNIQFENITSVDNQSELSNSLALKGNYPNPFAEQTNIEFDIENPGNVEVFIYDNSGNQIQKLECNNCRPGKNSLQWNCLDMKNNRVQSGVYFYEVRFGKEVLSKKMIVVK